MVSYYFVSSRIPPVWNGFFHLREALTSKSTISRHDNIPWKSTKYRYFGSSFAFFLYDMLVVTPCRSGTGMEFIMEQNGWNIPSSGNEPRGAKRTQRTGRITRRINAYLLQKVTEDAEQCSIEIICLFSCFIWLLVPSCILILLVCMIHMTRYMFSPYPCKDLCLLDQRKHSIRYDCYFSLMFVVVCSKCTHTFATEL